MLKKIIVLISLPAIVVLATYFYGVYQNNRDVEYPQTAQIQLQLEQSIQWLKNNETQILSQQNVMLWWMLFEVQKLSPDARIADLLNQYHQRYRVLNKVFGGRCSTECRAGI